MPFYICAIGFFIAFCPIVGMCFGNIAFAPFFLFPGNPPLIGFGEINIKVDGFIPKFADFVPGMEKEVALND